MFICNLSSSSICKKTKKTKKKHALKYRFCVYIFKFNTLMYITLYIKSASSIVLCAFYTAEGFTLNHVWLIC